MISTVSILYYIIFLNIVILIKLNHKPNFNVFVFVFFEGILQKPKKNCLNFSIYLNNPSRNQSRYVIHNISGFNLDVCRISYREPNWIYPLRKNCGNNLNSAILLITFDPLCEIFLIKLLKFEINLIKI